VTPVFISNHIGGGIVLLALLREDRAIIQPPPGELLAVGDKLVLFGGHAPLAATLTGLAEAGRAKGVPP